MNMFIDLTKRNIKLYLRDKSTVFFSLISSLIIIALFILFLGKVYIDNTVSQFAEYGTIERSSLQALIFSWILAGIIVLNSISIPQMILSRIILDKEANITNDFYVIPFKRSILTLSYLASSVLVGTVITYISFLVGEGYIYLLSGQLFSVSTHVLILGIILLCTTSFSSLMYLIYMFVKTSSTVGGLTAFTSSIGGFLAGIYISIGGLSGLTKDIISSNPLAHATALVRDVLMSSQIDSIFKHFPKEVVKEFTDGMGVNLYVGTTQLNNLHYIIGLVLVTVICFGISYFKLSKEKLS